MPGWVREALRCRLRCQSQARISENNSLGTHLWLWSNWTWFGQCPAWGLSSFHSARLWERHTPASPSALPLALSGIPLPGLLLQLWVKQPWLWSALVSGWEAVQRPGQDAGRGASRAGVLSSAQLCVGGLAPRLLFMSRGAAFGTGYKYCVLFSVSHLSGALGAHGKHLFARVCFSSADRRRQAARGHHPDTFPLEHLLGFGFCAAELSPGLHFTAPSQCHWLAGLHLVSPQLLHPCEVSLLI